MKKLNFLLYVFNFLFGLILFINCYFMYNYSSSSIILFILLIMFELLTLVLYVRNNKKYELTDYIVNTVYYLFLILYMVFMMFYQRSYDFNYNMMYFSKYLFIPHILYSLYNLK